MSQSSSIEQCVCEMMGRRIQTQLQLPIVLSLFVSKIGRVIREMMVEASHSSIDASSRIILILWPRGQKPRRLWEARR